MKLNQQIISAATESGKNVQYNFEDGNRVWIGAAQGGPLFRRVRPRAFYKDMRAAGFRHVQRGLGFGFFVNPTQEQTQ